MEIRDRITGLKRLKASEIKPNPKNWRTHPQAQQDALRGILAEVGIAGALIVRKLPEGGYMLLDGHMRADVSPDTKWPCLVLDVDEAEADKLLATFDPISAMAEADATKLDALLREIDTGSEALHQMLSELASESTAAAIAAMADDDAEEETDEEEQDDAGYQTFACPLTADQEQIVRRALRKARVKFACDSTGAALAKALEEWSVADEV